MKTIRQRLQSRISLRRNTIRSFENDVEAIKEIIRLGVDGLVGDLRCIREVLKVLRDEQKLDKILYVRLLQDEAVARFYGSFKDIE
jgi:ribosomal protein L19E